MLMLACPCQIVLAAMINTESILDTHQIHKTRAVLNNFMMNDEIQAALRSQGIDPAQLRAHLDNLSDEHIMQLADSTTELPAGAGGGPWGLVGIAVVVAFVILLITDLLGYTDMFNI